MTDLLVLAVFKPVVVAVLEPEPGWIWARCATCAETRYQRRAPQLGRCILTPGCRGEMTAYLQLLCAVCSRPVSLRRRDTNVEFCSKKCERGAAR